MKLNQSISFFPRLQRKQLKHHNASQVSANNSQNHSLNGKDSFISQRTYTSQLFNQTKTNRSSKKVTTEIGGHLLSPKFQGISKTPNFSTHKTAISKKSLREISLNKEFYKVEVTEKNEVLKEMEKQNQMLRDQIQTEKIQNEILQVQLREYRDKNSVQQVVIKQLHEKTQDYKENQAGEKKEEKFQKQIKLLQSEIVSLKFSKDLIHRRLKESEKEAKVYLENCQQLQNQINLGQRQIQETKQQAEQQQTVLNKRNSQILKKKDQDQTKEINRLQIQLNGKELDYDNLKQENECLLAELQNFYSIKPSREELLDQNDSLQIQMNDIKYQNDMFDEVKLGLQKQINKLQTEKENLQNQFQQEQKLSYQYRQEKTDIVVSVHNFQNKVEIQKNQVKKAQSEITKQLDGLKQNSENLKKVLTCCKCKEILKEPVTIIPCGHSYCKEKCKDAYDGKCLQCGPNQKSEAVYRNELFDDIIQMQQNIKGLQNSLDMVQLKELLFKLDFFEFIIQ